MITFKFNVVKGEFTTHLSANKDQSNLHAFVKFNVNLRSGENQSSKILDG